MAQILLADDNQKLRQSLADILEEEGYSVVQATNGHGVLAHLKAGQQCDLVITDIMMPDMEGLELIQALKKSHPSLDIIAISGSFECRFLPLAKRLGVKSTLEKPFKRAALLAAVESALPKKASPVA